MTTLVTGATGFVGSAVLRALLRRGEPVRALVRPSSSLRLLEGLPVDIVAGDLADPAGCRGALRGCDALFHVAADYRLWVPQPEAMYRTNVVGTRELLLAAAEAGVSRIVYTSSVATLGLRADHLPSDETTPATLADMIGHYKRSKFLAEKAVRELVTRAGLPAVIVNPSAPVGPADARPTPTGRVLLEAARGRIPAYVDTGLNLVHVDDVAEGISGRWIAGGWASATFSAEKTSRSARCSPLSHIWSAADRRGCACPQAHCCRLPSLPRRSPGWGSGASLWSPRTVSEWPESPCISRRPRPNGNLATAAGRLWKGCAMRSTGTGAAAISGSSCRAPLLGAFAWLFGLGLIAALIGAHNFDRVAAARAALAGWQHELPARASDRFARGRGAGKAWASVGSPPGALGAQESAILAAGMMVGIAPDLALAVALIKRARELAYGVIVLLAWPVIDVAGRRP